MLTCCNLLVSRRLSKPINCNLLSFDKSMIIFGSFPIQRVMMKLYNTVIIPSPVPNATLLLYADREDRYNTCKKSPINLETLSLELLEFCADFADTDGLTFTPFTLSVYIPVVASNRVFTRSLPTLNSMGTKFHEIREWGSFFIISVMSDLTPSSGIALPGSSIFATEI